MREAAIAQKSSSKVLADDDPTVTPDTCSTTVLSDEGPQSASIAREYSTTSHAHAAVTYTTSANSTLGVGVSTDGGDTFSADGTDEIDASQSDESDFATVSGACSNASNTRFDYKEYHQICAGKGGVQTKNVQLARPTAHLGGATNASLSSAVPSHGQCSPYDSGSGQWINSSTATTFSGGVDIKKWIGINLSAQSGYTSAVSIHYTFTGGSAHLCGTSGPAAHPGTPVAVP